MKPFVRNLEGCAQLDAIPTDPKMHNYQQDGFDHDPYPVPWADYQRIKSILMHVLGQRVFETLLRKDGRIDPFTYRQAAMILLYHVSRVDLSNDLQTTLICNALATRANGSTVHRSTMFNTVNQLIDLCMFEKDYADKIRKHVFEEGILDAPWWVQLKY